MPSLRKKLIWGMAATLATVIGLAGTAAYMITRPLEVAFGQDPNVVEEMEASRKLKLLNEAQAVRRQGFVRLSEVEINSFLEGRYNSGKHTPEEDPVKLVKAGVLLSPENITFVTWHQAALLGLDLPFVWQRVLSPIQGTNGWTFELESMRLGSLEVPAEYWTQVERFLGRSDSIFEERKNWLRNLPLISVERNEQSKAPELRLYTYVPKDKGGFETASAD